MIATGVLDYSLAPDGEESDQDEDARDPNLSKAAT